MSAGADPTRVYWYWRRTLLDPSTEPEAAVAASTIVAQMERWYPNISRSKPPADEQTGADLSNPWDFLITSEIHPSFHQEQNSPKRGQPVNWRAGVVGWVFSPEVPGRFGFVVGTTDTRVCIVVEGDPRIKDTYSMAGDSSLHIWVDRGAIHAPSYWYPRDNRTYGYIAAKTAAEETAVTYSGGSYGPFGRNY